MPLDTTAAYSAGRVGEDGRTLLARMQDVVNVLDFGAVGDFVADDTGPINEAITQVNLLGRGTLWFPSKFRYKTTTTTGLTPINPGVSVIMEGPIWNIGAVGTYAVMTIGSAGSRNNDYDGVYLDLWVNGNSVYTTPNVEHVGVRVYNLIVSSLRFRGYGTLINLQMWSTNGLYTSGNKVYLGKMAGQYALDLVADGSGSWMNSNVFYGGAIGHDAPTTWDKAGVRMRVINGGREIHWPKFFDTDIELGTSATNRSDAFMTTGSVYFAAYNTWLESCNTPYYNTDNLGYGYITYVSPANTDVISETVNSGSSASYADSSKSPYYPSSGSLAGWNSGWSYSLTGNVTNVPVDNGWTAEFVNFTGAPKTVTPASGGVLLLKNGVSQASFTLATNKVAVVKGDGTRLIVYGPDPT